MSCCELFCDLFVRSIVKFSREILELTLCSLFDDAKNERFPRVRRVDTEQVRKIARTWTSSRLCVTQQRLPNAICDYFNSPEPFYTRHITIPTVYMPRLKQTIVNPPRRTRSSHTHTGLSWLVYRLQPIVAKLGHRSLAFSSGRRTVSQ